MVFGMNPMNSIDHIIRIIAESREQLRSEFGVIGIGIFGSVVRGEQGADSDIGILVEFERPNLPKAEPDKHLKKKSPPSPAV